MSESTLVVCPNCDSVNRVPSDKTAMAAKCGVCHKGLFQTKPVALDAARFDHHRSRSGIPLLVDFWAPWCGPCHMMAPAFEAAARELEPAVRLIKINTEEAQPLAVQLGIRSIPTLVLFSDGREKARVSGAMDPRSLVRWTREHL